MIEALEEAGVRANTIIVVWSDHGFHLGEHGFYDKRDAYETSMRVPLLARGPGLKGGHTVSQLVQNIDIAPTLLDAVGVQPPETARFDGQSFWPLVTGRDTAWRGHILYEYHWEWNFPATPTLFAIRTDRYKFVYHHGVWDRDAFFDLQTDPIERHNLIDVPAYQERIQGLRDQLFRELKVSGALEVPFRTPAGERLDQRKLPN